MAALSELAWRTSIHDRILEQVDWTPTYINSLTASTPSCSKTPVHFPTDQKALAAIAPTVGKKNLSDVTYCRIRNTLELVDTAISENLAGSLPSDVSCSEPFEIALRSDGNLQPFPELRPDLEKASLHA